MDPTGKNINSAFEQELQRGQKIRSCQDRLNMDLQEWNSQQPEVAQFNQLKSTKIELTSKVILKGDQIIEMKEEILKGIEAELDVIDQKVAELSDEYLSEVIKSTEGVFIAGNKVGREKLIDQRVAVEKMDIGEITSRIEAEEASDARLLQLQSDIAKRRENLKRNEQSRREMKQMLIDESWALENLQHQIANVCGAVGPE